MPKNASTVQRGSGERRFAAVIARVPRMTTGRPTGRRLPSTTGAKTNGMWSRVLDKNSTSFAQECTVRLFLEVERSAGAAPTSGVGLPEPATDHRNNFSSWRDLTTWRARLRKVPTCCQPINCYSFLQSDCVKQSRRTAVQRR